MAEKKKDTKKAAAKAGEAVTSRCDQGGKEIEPVGLRVSTGNRIELLVVLCRTQARVVVYLDKQQIAEHQTNTGGDEMRVLVPALSPGFHALHWGMLNTGPQWKSLSVVAVDGSVRFLQRKGAVSDKPYNHSFLLLEAV